MYKNARFENTKVWDAAKKPTFFSGLPSLNSFHILTRHTGSNHLKQKKKKKKKKKSDKNAIFDQK